MHRVGWPSQGQNIQDGKLSSCLFLQMPSETSLPFLSISPNPSATWAVLLKQVRRGPRCNMLQTHEHQAISDARGTASAGESVSCLFDAGQELTINVGMDEKKYVFRLQSFALAILFLSSQVSEEGRFYMVGMVWYYPFGTAFYKISFFLKMQWVHVSGGLLILLCLP